MQCGIYLTLPWVYDILLGYAADNAYLTVYNEINGGKKMNVKKRKIARGRMMDLLDKLGLELAKKLCVSKNFEKVKQFAEGLDEDEKRKNN